MNQYEKGKRINDDFGRLSSLSKRSSNNSDRAHTNRKNLRLDDPIHMGQLFTGKYDATSKNFSAKNLNLNIEFPMKNVSATQSNQGDGVSQRMMRNTVNGTPKMRNLAKK